MGCSTSSPQPQNDIMNQRSGKRRYEDPPSPWHSEKRLKLLNAAPTPDLSAIACRDTSRAPEGLRSLFGPQAGVDRATNPSIVDTTWRYKYEIVHSTNKFSTLDKSIALSVSKAAETKLGRSLPSTISQDRSNDEVNKARLLSVLRERPGGSRLRYDATRRTYALQLMIQI